MLLSACYVSGPVLKHLTCINSFNSHDNAVRDVLSKSLVTWDNRWLR